MRDDCNGWSVEEHPMIVLRTSDGCGRVVPRRCPRWRGCPLCEARWIRALYGKFFGRVEQSGVALDRAIMWTLGTSLKDSPENRRILARYWTRFRKHMNKYQQWDPVFRVVEAGSKGKRLHIHLVLVSQTTHAIVLKQWRKITGERSNVNFTAPVHSGHLGLLRYLLKYLTKQGTRYYWLGALYNAHPEPYDGVVCEHGNHYHPVFKATLPITRKIERSEWYREQASRYRRHRLRFFARLKQRAKIQGKWPYAPKQLRKHPLFRPEAPD